MAKDFVSRLAITAGAIALVFLAANQAFPPPPPHIEIHCPPPDPKEDHNTEELMGMEKAHDP